MISQIDIVLHIKTGAYSQFQGVKGAIARTPWCAHWQNARKWAPAQGFAGARSLSGRVQIALTSEGPPRCHWDASAGFCRRFPTLSAQIGGETNREGPAGAVSERGSSSRSTASRQPSWGVGTAQSSLFVRGLSRRAGDTIKEVESRVFGWRWRRSVRCSPLGQRSHIKSESALWPDHQAPESRPGVEAAASPRRRMSHQSVVRKSLLCVSLRGADQLLSVPNAFRSHLEQELSVFAFVYDSKLAGADIHVHPEFRHPLVFFCYPRRTECSF